jgi:hypothetical protein
MNIAEYIEYMKEKRQLKKEEIKEAENNDE